MKVSLVRKKRVDFEYGPLVRKMASTRCIRQRKNGPVRPEIPEATNLKWEQKAIRLPVSTPASALILVMLQWHKVWGHLAYKVSRNL